MVAAITTAAINFEASERLKLAGLVLIWEGIASRVSFKCFLFFEIGVSAPILKK
jgi:hypothetical protein